MLSLAAEAGDSDKILMLKLVAIVCKVDIFKSYECDMHISV